MAAYEVLLLNTAIPQIQAAQSGDTYVVPRDIAINATAIISANSATDALRITQTGAGNAILVEDSANPDSSPFVVTAAGDVGIGTTSPAGNLNVNTTGNTQVTISAGNTGLSRLVFQGQVSNNRGFIDYDNTAAVRSFIFRTNEVEVMRLDSSGNLGLGVTPSAWLAGGGSNQWQAIEIPSGALQSQGTIVVGVMQNAFASSIGAFTYKTTAPASWSYQYNGEHYWANAASGTANTTFTFTERARISSDGTFRVKGAGTAGTTDAVQFSGSAPASAMTLDASGNLLVGDTSNPGGRFYMKGGYARFSDGTYTGLFGKGSDLVVGGGASDLAVRSDAAILFSVGSAEKARITSGGAFLVGTNTAYTTAADTQIASKSSSGTGFSHFVLGNSTQGYLYINIADVYTWNNAASVLYTGSINSTGRSINASGTVNASGADYAEYMTKAGNFTIAKGDVCGVDADGNLTNVFANAVSFVVKSTNPSYVGGDTWGVGLDKDSDELQAARQKVDRVAFAGQVPVNVMGAKSGQYIVPVNDNGAIKGVAKDEADMTLAEYMKAVGKVIAIESDGRARIIVKVS